jgi:chemotaxis protein MotB
VSEDNKKEKRGKEEPQQEGVAPWLTTYTDLMTLMLAFFVILVSFGTFEQGRIVKLLGSVRGTFKILEGGFKTDPSEQVITASKDIIESYRDPTSMVEEIGQRLKARGIKEGVHVEMREREIAINFSDYLLFNLGPGETEISPEMKSFLKELADIILPTSYVVRIEGHTDDIPIKTEEFPSNWELSAKRAIAVLRYFVEEGGIAPLRLSAAGFAQYRPLFPNDTTEHRAKNRRVMIYLQPNKLKTDERAKSPLYKEGVVKPL